MEENPFEPFIGDRKRFLFQFSWDIINVFNEVIAMILLNGKNLDLETFVQVARYHELVSISDENKMMVHKAERYVAKVAGGNGS